MQQRSHVWWKGIIGSAELLAAYQEEMYRLETGDFNPGDFSIKNKADPRVYGFRLNGKERLLFTTIQVNGDYYLYLLDDLLNHKYEACTSMDIGHVRNRLYSEQTERHIKEFFQRKQQNSNSNAVPDFTYQYAPIEFFKKQLVFLDEAQQAILKAPTPLICTGPAGSGKSLLILALLGKMVENGVQSIYYITQNPKLCAEMEKEWRESPLGSNQENKNAIIFTTYENLLKKQYPDFTLISTTEYKTWLSKYLKKMKQQATHQKTTNHYPITCTEEEMYAEFRVISGFYPNQKQAYCDESGVQLSRFDANIRNQLWEIYENHQKELHSHKMMHPAFTPLKEIACGFAAIDEIHEGALPVFNAPTPCIL